MTFSFLQWENIANLPFPDEVKPLLEKVDWKNRPWQVNGLPEPFATYSVLDGKTLYLDELQDGTSKVMKMDQFTGNILMGNFFLDENPEGTNFFIMFLVTFLKGEVVETQLHQVRKQASREYIEAFASFQRDMHTMMKRSNSWWFRWLYLPYAVTVRIIASILVGCLGLLKFIIVRVAKFLTPL